MAKILILAEKRQVADTLSEVILRNSRKEGHAHVGTDKNGDNVTIVALSGHIFDTIHTWEQMGIPKDEFYEKVKSGDIELPIEIKAPFNIKKQFKVPADQYRKRIVASVKQLMQKDWDYIYSATDPDSEGALIFYETVTFFNKDPYKNTYQINTSGMAEEFLKKAYSEVKDTPFSTRKGEVNKALCRSLYDKTIGFNETMFARRQSGGVQNVVTHLVGERTILRRDFKEVTVYTTTATINGDIVLSNGVEFETEREALDVIGELPNKININVSLNNKKENPPLPHNQTTLPAAKSLKNIESVSGVANALRLEHGLVSYFRVKPKKLYPASINTSERILKSNSEFAKYIQKGFSAGAILTDKEIKKIKDSGKELPHDAITITGDVDSSHCGSEKKLKLSKNEFNVYDEVRRRIAANFMNPLTYEEEAISSDSYTVGENDMVYKKNRNRLKDIGFGEVYPYYTTTFTKDEDILEAGEYDVEYSVKPVVKKAPGNYSINKLIAKMENIANEVEDEELRAIYKQVEGIGTSATAENIVLKLAGKHIVKNQTTKENEIKPIPGAKNPILDINTKTQIITMTDYGLAWYENYLKANKVSSADLKTRGYVEIKLNEVQNETITKEEFQEFCKQEVAKSRKEMPKQFKYSGGSSKGNKGGGKPTADKDGIATIKSKSGSKFFKDETSGFLIGETVLGTKITKTDAKKLLKGKPVTKKLTKPFEHKVHMIPSSPTDPKKPFVGVEKLPANFFDTDFSVEESIQMSNGETIDVGGKQFKYEKKGAFYSVKKI